MYADNGTTYDAWALVGSIALALPGQIAEIGFLTTDCPATGTTPVPTVSFDENSTAAGAPAGAVLTESEDDPPQLTASTTILGRRFYLNQTGQPAWCRHMQIRFNWGSTNSPDELYTYTIFGAARGEG